jgi:hypothetical protein
MLMLNLKVKQCIIQAMTAQDDHFAQDDRFAQDDNFTQDENFAEDDSFAEDDRLLNEPFISQRSLLRSKSSIALALLGWLTIGSTLNSIIFNSLPIKLAMPDWQLSLIGSLLNSSFPLLIGVSLIVFAQFLNLKDQTLQHWKLMAGRFASLYALLLVLMIPLQIFPGQSLLRQQTIPTTEAVNNLQRIIWRINALNSERELRVYVASLSNPPSLPDKFDATFPEIKNRAIENIKAQIRTINNNTQLQKSQALQTFFKEAMRNAIHAILMATAFSVLANLVGGVHNKVTRFFTALV